MLQVQNLQIKRGSGTSFHIALPELTVLNGEVLAIRGASGCGKSTILEMLGLILTPDTLDSYQLGLTNQTLQQIAPQLLTQQEKSLAQLRATYFGFMLQSGGLLPFLTVQQNMALSNQLLGKPLDQDWIDYLILQLNVGHLLSHYPKQLSIGERQRVSFIRSIAHKPAVLLADEPTAALDPQNAAKLIEIIIHLVKQHQLSALIVTHDWELLKAYQLPSLKAEVIGQRAIFRAEGASQCE